MLSEPNKTLLSKSALYNADSTKIVVNGNYLYGVETTI